MYGIRNNFGIQDEQISGIRRGLHDTYTSDHIWNTLKLVITCPSS